jgi:chromosome segregation ATPase
MPSELVNQRSRFLVACEKRAVYGKLKKAERDLADLQRQARMLELRNEKLGLEGQRNTLQASKAAIELTVVDIETKITAKQDELAGNVARLLELRAMMNENPSNFGLFAEYGQMGPAGKTLEAELQQLVAEKQGIDDQIGAANEQIVALEDRIAEIEAQLQ